MIRVLLVDDHVRWRRQLRTELEMSGDIVVVGEASAGPGAVLIAERTKADVVIMEVRMPEDGGIAATRALADAHPDTPVVLMAAYDVDAVVFAALDAGARGFVLKTDGSAVLANAVRSAASGEGALSARIVHRVMDRARRTSRTRAPVRSPAKLTVRETDIVRELCSGPTGNDEIAARLGLSQVTVKSHLRRVVAKVGVNSRAELVAWAFRAGIVT